MHTLFSERRCIHGFHAHSSFKEKRYVFFLLLEEYKYNFFVTLLMGLVMCLVVLYFQTGGGYIVADDICIWSEFTIRCDVKLYDDYNGFCQNCTMHIHIFTTVLP